MEKIMFKHKPYTKMSINEKFYKNQMRKNKIELVEVKKYNKLLASLSK